MPEGQGKLDLLPAIPAKPRTLGTTVEAVICCEASVAIPLHRALAAAIDWIMVLIGYGLFLAAFWLGGGAFVLSKPNLLVFGGALLLVGFTYGLLFAIAGTETAGMRWTRLQVMTFDGFPPDGGQRLLRFAGACLSLSHGGWPVVVPGRRRGSHLDGPHFPHLSDAPRMGLSSFPPAVSWNYPRRARPALEACKNEHPIRREEPAGRYGWQSQRSQPFRNRALPREGSESSEIFPPAKR